MNEQIDEKTEDIRLSELNAMQFLRSHPDFLFDHPELLAEISIPHERGIGVVSLIERQVLVMRRQIDAMQKKLKQAGDNEALHQHLIEQLRHLADQLLNAKSPEVLYKTLSASLEKSYKAKHTRLFVFTSLPTPANFAGIRFLKKNARIKHLFSGIFNHHRPLCGSLQDEHIRALFDSDAERIHSTVLIPLKQDSWEGLLALGSDEWNCYRHGVALELLVFVSDILEKTINVLVRSES